MTREEAMAIDKRNMEAGKPRVPVADYTGFGTFTVKGKKYSGEGIQMRWKGQPTYEGFITSDKWVVVFPDGTKLAFNPKEDLAKDGSEECLTQSAFPD